MTVPQAMQGTNSVVLALLPGQFYGPFAGATVHVDDVARAMSRRSARASLVTEATGTPSVGQLW
ncbi:hypothetical protein N657DRAFT_648854 [Parathielavia appendiculata]|uniref:Uncharacterized protein n=1 Tax=Parathielavia appendiculata TaxID=2587402 RepID=A0AAN6Z0P1_9PEZI|nr:hypothetical protein N657DRAFT_648854 [Parathielavia appendiculata]